MVLLNNFLKRAFDIISCFLALILLFPLWFLIAVAIKCDSEGPVLFVQKRRTRNGRIFKMYKFRTMVINAESMGTGLFNFENDPRVTKVGRILRNTSLDELPQLLNVIKGDLSVVGPRPCVVYELGDFDTLNRKYKKRFQVRGGITGLAQAKGRNVNSWDEKVAFDNLYIDEFKKQGVWLDIKILAWTLISVFQKKDIYEEQKDLHLDPVEAARLAEAEIIRIAHLPDEEMEETTL